MHLLLLVRARPPAISQSHVVMPFRLVAILAREGHTSEPQGFDEVGPVGIKGFHLYLCTEVLILGSQTTWGADLVRGLDESGEHLDPKIRGVVCFTAKMERSMT